MIILRTGVPGASKTLNSLKELVENHSPDREYFYNNVKLLMLDFDVVRSFSGWFYGWYFPRLEDSKQLKKITKILKPIHDEDEFATVDDLPWLEDLYQAHDHFQTWLYWVRKVYPKSKLEKLELFLECSSDSNIDYFEKVGRFNLDFRYFDDARDWFNLPKRAVIFIDECQQSFPPRAVGGKKPEYISKFETHRHSGHDIHLVTQDGMLIDVNIRRLCGRHIHFFNAFGGERVTRFQSPIYFDTNDYHAKKGANKKLVKRDHNFYGVYWSAEIHTHTFVFPKMALLIPILLILICAAVYLLYDTLFSKGDVVAAAVPEQTQSQGVITEVDNMLSLIAKDVFISGSVISEKSGELYFDYSFLNTESGKIFYPERIGVDVMPKSHCLAILKLDDSIYPITCDPFYQREVVSDDDTQLAKNDLSLGDEIKGVELF